MTEREVERADDPAGDETVPPFSDAHRGRAREARERGREPGVDTDTAPVESEIVRLAEVAANQRRIPCLVVLDGPGFGRRLELCGRSIIGRAHGCEVRLDDPSVSRRHAVVDTRHGRWAIEDLRSLAGTFVNGLPAARGTTLRSGDKITVGTTTLRFGWDDALDAAYHDRLYEAAVRDTVTDTYKRRQLDEHLREVFARAHPRRTPVAVLVVGVDYLRAINDCFGYGAGDAVLSTLGVRAQELGYAGRTGADEIAIVLTDETARGALHVAESLRSALANEPVRWRDHRVDFAVSVGVAVFPDVSVASGSALLAAADLALQRAKLDGRNCVRVAG